MLIRLVIMIFFFTSVAQAQLLSSYVREQVGTLPRGRFMLSLVQVTSNVDRIFGQDGIKKPLSDSFDQGVSYQKIVNEESVRGSQLAGLFLSNGLELADSAGSISGSLTGTVNAKVPVVGYGITDDLGIYFSIPILQFQIQSQYRFQSSEKTQKFLQHLRDDDQKSVASEFDVALATSLESKLYKSGYQWDANLNRTYLGDLQIMLLKVMDTSGWDTRQKWMLQPTVVLPTATDQDIRDLYGLKAGDRRFGLGLKSGYQRAVDSRLQFNAAAATMVLLPTSGQKRLPKDSEDDLREFLDESTRITGGAKLSAQTQLRYEFPRWVGFNAGLQWQRRLSENYQGNKYDAEVYARASELSGQELLSAYASVDLNSIKSFLEGGFLIPVVAELGVGLPLRGRNSIAEPVIQFQGSTFF